MLLRTLQRNISPKQVSKSKSLLTPVLATASPTRKSSTTSTSSSSAGLQQVSTLPNGIRVATEDTPGHFCGIGVYVDAGSRYEWAGDCGSTHLIDRLAWKSTQNRTGQEIISEIEALGGQFAASSSRETILYQAATYPDKENLSRVLAVLGETVLRPLFTEEELGAELEAAAYEISEVEQKADAILPEVVHEVAYRGNTLGNPLLCPMPRLNEITAESVRRFRDTWYRPERIVIAGAGIEHEFLRKLAQEHFGYVKKTSSSSTISSSSSSSSTKQQQQQQQHSLGFHTSAKDQASVLANEPTFEARASAPAVYTGGTQFLDEPEILPHGALPNMVHLHVGFKGLSINDQDIYALATIQMLLGGGGSFSAGGPGKGMYSRLYTTVLNQHYLVDHCSAFHHCYMDGGLFGIAISLDRRIASRAGMIVAEQLASLLENGRVTEQELARARNQLKSSLIMALESRMVQVEDLGRQTLVHGYKVPVEEICAKIDAVSLADVQRVSRRVLCESGAPPTVVAQGKLDSLGDVTKTLARYGLGV